MWWREKRLWGRWPLRIVSLLSASLTNQEGCSLFCMLPLAAESTERGVWPCVNAFAAPSISSFQAAATENGILISLSDQHSFPLDSIFAFLSSHSVRDVLIQALLAAPLFGTRWRWNASRALAILRFLTGRKVPPPLQRIRSDDLLASIFPEQAACLENIQGDIVVPDHPLVFETVRDCVNEAMDVDGLIEILSQIEGGQIQCVAVDTREPSPFSHEILKRQCIRFPGRCPSGGTSRSSRADPENFVRAGPRTRCIGR